MRCDNQFCIYWDSGLCLLTAISLDAQGACRDCVEITLPECHPESGPFRLQKGGRKGREPVVSGNPHGTGKYGSYMSRGRRRFRRPLFSVVSRIGMLAVFLLKVLQCHSERLDDERRKRAVSARIAFSTPAMTSFGIRMHLFVVGGMDGILNFLIISPPSLHNICLPLLCIDFACEYVSHMYCNFSPYMI